jgi:anthranilate synthase component II
MKKILVLDNYDSFTYNLVHLIGKVSDADVDVFRNDLFEVEQGSAYSHIILSPGPGIPSEAGVLMPLISRFATAKKMLGVCLGHQALAEVFGGKIYNSETVFHGVATEIRLEEENGFLFRDIPARFKAGRYHSWLVDENFMPDVLRVTARDEEGRIMAMQHRTLPVAGVQFHPESILSEYGEELMRNFLSV